MSVPLEYKRHELFCRCVARGGKPGACMKRAGYPYKDEKAAKALTSNKRIARRIAVLRLEKYLGARNVPTTS